MKDMGEEKATKINIVRGHKGRKHIEFDDPEFSARMERDLCEKFREKFRGTSRWPFVSQLTDEQISRGFVERSRDASEEMRRNMLAAQMRSDIENARQRGIIT